LPSNTGPHPIVAFIHGGFYRAKYGLEHAGWLCQALADCGIAAWSIEYRRLGNPGGGWPNTFLDVLAGTHYVRVLAERFPLDLDRLALMGHSAGGHLALWAAAARSIPLEEPLHDGQPLALRAAVSLAGVLEPRRAWSLRLGDHVIQELLGGGPEQVPERYAVASPGDLLPVGIPQILVHGKEDEVVPLEMSAGYAARARAAGEGVIFLPLSATGHFDLIDPGSRVWPQVLDLVRQALDLQP
jgi:acetyl esterase/lipase